MYTFNSLVFGHNFYQKDDLVNELEEWDFNFSKKYNDREFELSFPYHGGQINTDIPSLIFGTNISDDDCNQFYIDEVRSAKSEDYIEDYKLFIEDIKKAVNDDIGIAESEEEKEQYLKIVNDLFEYLDNTEPIFYSVEQSS